MTEQVDVAEMVVLGKVTGAYGIQGWLRIAPFGDDPLSWGRMKTWWLADDPAGSSAGAGSVASATSVAPGAWTAFSLLKCRNHAGTVVVELAGVSDRNASEALIGKLIGAPRAQLPKPATDEYYWADLIGLTVINTQGDCLGTVESLIETGAHDVLRVLDASGAERLIPFVAHVVTQVDLTSARIEVDWGADW